MAASGQWVTAGTVKALCPEAKALRGCRARLCSREEMRAPRTPADGAEPRHPAPRPSSFWSAGLSLPTRTSHPPPPSLGWADTVSRVVFYVKRTLYDLL